MDYYSSPIGITSQFRFCGNCFRIDLYKGCDFGCEYCFINNTHPNNRKVNNLDLTKLQKIADIHKIEKLFFNVFDKNILGKDSNKHLLKNKTPLHLGGNSDPFQKSEFDFKLSYKFLELSKKYQYPVMLSTKGLVPDNYFNILDNNLHAFQISLFSDKQDEINLFETNTPSVDKRMEQIYKLKRLGFWVSVRIQPLIYLDSAISLIDKLKNTVNFFTIEHIKLTNNINKPLLNKLNHLRFVHKGNYIKVADYMINDNLIKIKKIFPNVLFGFGDNEFHYLSSTNNCCGIDCINNNFGNWLKYNKLNLYRNNNISNCFIPVYTNPFEFIKEKGVSYKEWVDYYHKNFKYYCENDYLF